MEDNQVLLKTKGYRVMDSADGFLKYGVTVYQVVSQEKSLVWHPSGTENVESADCPEYSTTSRAKANAVCEYLTLKDASDEAEYGQNRHPTSIKA